MGTKARQSAVRAIVIALAALLSVALIAFAFFRPVRDDGALRLAPRFAFSEWIAELPSHLPWVVPFIVLTATLPALRAIVWRQTLPSPSAPFRALFHAVALGGLAQNAIPGRLGIFVSAWVLSRDIKAPVGVALSSLLLGKLLELGALFGAAALVALVAHLRGVGGGPAQVVLIVGAAALAGFTALLFAARGLAPRIASRLRARGRLRRLAELLEATNEGLRHAGSTPHLLGGLACALGPVLASSLAYGLALRHLGVEAFLLGGGLLLGAITLGQFTPGLPIGTGVYYFVCTSTARALGVPDAAAAALAVLTHAATAASHLVVGLVSALAHHDRLRDLFRLRRALETTDAQPTTSVP